jgi:prolipoprotein diacylglyceryltransferase
MLPVLLSIGSFKLYSYGVFLFTSLFVGLYWWWKLGRDENLEETSLFDTFFIAMFSGFALGRAVYVILNIADFTNIYRILGVYSFPGVSLVGTLVGVIATVFVISRNQEWETPKIADNLAVTLGVVMVIGSLGGLLNGSLGGVVVDLIQLVWALVYFVLVSRVRKDFRFYSWYKQNRTVAPDGLAALIGLLMLGVIYFIRGFLEETWRVGPLAYYTIFGFVIVLTSALAIYLRSGRTLFRKK